jgi:hypothetical protein
MDTIGMTTFKVLGETLFFFFYLTPGIRSLGSTNPSGA